MQISKICQYLRLHTKAICWRFHIKSPFTFWDMHMWNMWKVCLQTFSKNRISWKLAYFLRNLQTSRVNNLKTLTTENVKFSRYCFYMNTNTYWDFQVYISVPLNILIFLLLLSHPTISKFYQPTNWIFGGLVIPLNFFLEIGKSNPT